MDNDNDKNNELTQDFLISEAINRKIEKSVEQNQQVTNTKYESALFFLTYPKGYYIKDKGADGHLHTLLIGKDSLDKDITTIMWEIPNTFPGSLEDFVTIFVSEEMKECEKSNTFYDVMKIDSTYTIDGYPTYSITSIFSEGKDSIIQSRTGLIIPQKCDMMIIQRANTKKSVDDVQKMSEIIQSIKIKQ